jgi:molybdate transport system regulatory protein
MKPKLRVWVLFPADVKLGAGRAALLQAIDELGSIKAAAEQFEMSYRYAWGYLRELEQAAGFQFVERQRGGGETGGAALTPRGKEFLTRYREFNRRMDAAAKREYARIFQNSRPGKSGRDTGGRSSRRAG